MAFFKPKIVRFNNGKYGVRKGFWPFYFYLDDQKGSGIYRDKWWSLMSIDQVFFNTELAAREARGAFLAREKVRGTGVGTVVKERSE